MMFDQLFEPMTPEQAATVRRWRVDEGATWRAVASLFAERYGTEYGTDFGGPFGGNQLAGMAICRRAALMHNEHWMDNLWN